MADEYEDAVDYEIDEDAYPAYQWTKELAVADAMTFAAKLAQLTSEYLTVMAQRSSAQNNQAVERKVMFSDAAQEIEKMTEGD